jgi:hypothetical protein
MSEPAAQSGMPIEHGLEVARGRLALLMKVAATGGEFSPRLAQAVDAATDEEVRIMTDLVDRGLSIPSLVSFLQGAHVIVGDDALYERWIFPSSHRRMSSHHRTVDKSRTPDYGYDGPLVREALHGRAESGTWVQLERTRATFRPGRLPTWTDVVHIRDYVIYRVTGKNVGPWGLSAHVDTRPMVLRPRGIAAGKGAVAGLEVLAGRRVARSDDVQARGRWSDALTPDVAPIGPAGALFGAPMPDDPLDLLPEVRYQDDLGLGLFGSLPLVRATASLPLGVLGILDAPVGDVQLSPPAGTGKVVTVPLVAGSSLSVQATSQDTRQQTTSFLDL